MNKKKRIFHLCWMLMLAHLLSAQYSVVGGEGSPYLAEQGNNLQVYLLNGMNGAEIRYTSYANVKHNWFKYQGTEITPIQCEQDGNTSWIVPQDGYGYYVESDRQKYVWIIDYSAHRANFDAPQWVDSENKCDFLTLKFNIDATPLVYYTSPSTGFRKELERTFVLSYDSLGWNEEDKAFYVKPVEEIIAGVQVEYSITAPFTNTTYTLSGDNFAAYFGLQQSKTSEEYQATAVTAHGYAEQEERDNDNEENSSVGDNVNFGGSAPVTVMFNGYANEPVASLYIWKIYKNEDGPDYPLVRILSEDVTYTFQHFGDYTARLEVSNTDGTCVDSSVTYTIKIVESSLKIPNAFSPGTTPGKNDEFKVVYKSIIRFKGVIFNRWGGKVFEWTSPDQGWDGKFNGKYVPPGAYYYIIEAEGSDGIKYNKQGDINVLRPKEINDTLPDDGLN